MIRAFFTASIALVACAASAAPVVHHSPADDGVPAAPDFSLAPGAQTLHLYIETGTTASSADPCDAGDGEELCGWQVVIAPSGAIELGAFTPAADVAASIDASRLRAVGGDAVAGALGARKIGDLVVTVNGAGSLLLSDGKHLDAVLALAAIPPATIVSAPEPGAALVAAAALATLLVVARLRAISLAALALLLAFAAPARADLDADGIADAEDVCPTRFDPGQEDAGGLDVATPDGIGDACQCGDVDDDGKVDLVDVARLQRLVGPAEPLAAPAKCPGTACDAASVGLLRQALADETPPATCAAASELACFDPFEPNDARATSRFLGDFSDQGDGSSLVATLPPGDQDWFAFDLIDEIGLFEPFARVSTAVADYDVCFYVDCDNGNTASFECATGTPALVDGIPGCCNTAAGGGTQAVEIDGVSCGGLGTNEDSRIFVRVFRPSSLPAACGVYTLDFGG